MKGTVRRKSAVLLMALLVLMALGGCHKKPMTTDDFRSLAQAEGLTVTDGKENFEAYNDIIEVTVASNEVVRYSVTLFVFSDEVHAQAFWSANQLNMQTRQRGNYYYNKSHFLLNYASYSLQTQTEYMFIEQWGNTVLYVPPTSVDNQARIETLVKAMES